MMNGIVFVFGKIDGDDIFYFPVLMGVIYMYIQMGILLALEISKDGHKKRDMLNKKYLKMQEEQYDYL